MAIQVQEFNGDILVNGSVSATYLAEKGTSTTQAMSQEATTNAINEVAQLAEENRFTVEIVYDMASSSPEINHGFPNGVKTRTGIPRVDLSRYRFLIIDCQFDRNLTMFMDLTELNKKNNFYINSMAGTHEYSLAFGFISLEIIVNRAKNLIYINNLIRSTDYSAGSELIPDEDAFVSKIYGIE